MVESVAVLWHSLFRLLEWARMHVICAIVHCTHIWTTPTITIKNSENLPFSSYTCGLWHKMKSVIYLRSMPIWHYRESTVTRAFKASTILVFVYFIETIDIISINTIHCVFSILQSLDSTRRMLALCEEVTYCTK